MHLTTSVSSAELEPRRRARREGGGPPGGPGSLFNGTVG